MPARLPDFVRQCGGLNPPKFQFCNSFALVETEPKVRNWFEVYSRADGLKLKLKF